MSAPQNLPNEDVRKFLAETIPQLSEFEKMENLDLARRLCDLSANNKYPNISKISESFSWLHGLGVISFDRVLSSKGGWRLLLYRNASPEASIDLIVSGNAVNKDVIKEKCCDNKRVVKSKKTGKRKCKNCGKAYPNK